MIQLIRLMMMCELGELTRECGAATPGLSKIYAIDVADVVSIPSPNGNWTIISDIILKSGKYWKDLPFVEQKSGLSDEIADAVGGGFKKNLPFKLSKYSAQTNKWLNNMIGARFIVVVADNNGQMILIGDKVASMRMEKGTGTTGQKFGDENGWDINFTAEGVKPCLFYTGTIVLPDGDVLTVSTQPTAQTLTAGASFSLTAAATGGTAPFAHQWRKGGSPISGATSATFTKSGAATGDTGSYDDVITDALGATVTTNAVTVTVNALGTFDTTLDFTSNAYQTDTDGGIGALISGTSSVIKLKYNKIDPPTGIPATMQIMSGATELMRVDGFACYNGQTFVYVNGTGNHPVIFANGEVQI